MKLPPALPLVFSFLLACIPASGADRPNILVVLVDDAGYGDFGCHGHPFLKTPNIDRLQRESIRLTDFHVAPMCTPTRGQLLTGVDAVRNGATSVTGGRSFLRPELPTLPGILAGAGYQTGIFGKWHLGDNFPHRPMDKGFRTAVWIKGWGFTSAPEFANSHFDGRYYRGDQTLRFQGYITDFCFDEAMAWMKASQAKQEPFFCYIPLHAAHTPHQVPERFAAPYREIAGRAAEFFGMLANIDENMGRLEQFLQASGLRDNTLCIFMTDNGGTAGVRFYNANMRGKKTEFYEGGHRVPAFIRWPAGNLRAAGDVALPTQIQDLAPTLLEFAGLPAGEARFDGVSLAGLLRGTAPSVPERMFVVQYSRAKLEKWECAVVWNEWRLVHGTELYRISTDPNQKTDLAKAQPEIVGRLRAHYEDWWRGLGSKVNEFVPVTIGSPAQPQVELTSADWQDVYCDNSDHIRQAVGGPRGGVWHLLVSHAGEYEIILRRWPAELDLPLTASQGAESQALPIAAARIRIADRESQAPASGNAKEIKLQVRLPSGPTQLQAWFQDGKGNDLCGAFYATLRRSPHSN